MTKLVHMPFYGLVFLFLIYFMLDLFHVVKKSPEAMLRGGFLFVYLRFQVLKLTMPSIGRISSLPASISKIKTSFDKTL